MSVFRIALIGNPNTGKSTLFNALTGSQQSVGNWPGVTVERKSGRFTHQEITYECIDLPGIYALQSPTDETALDERIALNFLVNEPIDLLINVVDANHLERHLYLTTQCREMQLPMILVLNMMDLAHRNNIHINIKAMSNALKCPVIPLSAHKEEGIPLLLNHLEPCIRAPIMPLDMPLPAALQESYQTLETELQAQNKPTWWASRLLSGDGDVQADVSASLYDQALQLKMKIKQNSGEDADILLADGRYHFVHRLIGKVLTVHHRQHHRLTARLDKVILNRGLGLPLFFGIMYLMFIVAIHLGGLFQDAFNIASMTLFVEAPAILLSSIQTPPWLIAIIADGVGKGINTTVTFIPVLASMFFCMAFLEQCGYMARAAFVMDRAMRALGLSGKAFVPLIIGFGCNVPSVIATRTLSQPRDRILTSLMAPFMSCGARLAIFAVFTAAFFPTGGQNVVFALYCLGILVAIVTGLIVRHTLLPGPPTPLVMELPSYHWPTLRGLWVPTRLRTLRFIHRAGTVIVPLCMVLSLMNALDFHGQLITAKTVDSSILAILAKQITPIFAPMGLHADNWPATVGLLTGAMAKEVVIATLNTLYSHVGALADNTAIAASAVGVLSGLADAGFSILEKLRALPTAFLHPMLAAAPSSDLTPGAYGIMVQRFGDSAAAFAYLVFVLLYVPCFSTIAAISREINRGWAWFSLCWSLIVAYALAVICYQAATFHQHPQSSLLWIFAMLSMCASLVVVCWMQGVGFQGLKRLIFGEKACYKN